MAVAVALAAPATVLGQGSSVQIYGGLSVSFEAPRRRAPIPASRQPAGGARSEGGTSGSGGNYTNNDVNEPARTRLLHESAAAPGMGGPKGKDPFQIAVI